jgi:outer membrane protein assembly factor BamB
MKFPITLRKQPASFRIVGLTLVIAPLWLMLAAANTSAYAQTSDNVSNASATTPAPSPADWTEFHGDNMQRWNPYETVLNVNNVGSLQVMSKNPIGNYTYFLLESSPAVVNGVVYVGSEDFNLHALNAGTGVKLWSYHTGNAVFSSPAVVNGVVYVGSDDNNVYALNASTGTKLWSFATGSYVESSPAVVNGVVYIGSYDSNVYALNAGTGAKLWSYHTGNAVISSPAVANGVVYVGSSDNYVYALNASTGAKLWSYATGFQIDSSPAVANGVVYVGSSDNNVYALNTSTGAKLWSYSTGGTILASSPAVANGVAYIGSTDGNVYALNASTGAKLWSYFTGGEAFSSPAVANGVVYVGSYDSNVYALDASTGAKLWSYTPGNEFVVSSPTIVDGVVYIGIGDYFGGNIYAFALGASPSADLFLRIRPTLTTVHQGDLITYAFPVWNLGPDAAVQEVLNTQVPEGTVFDYIRISGTPGLGTCTHPPYQGTGQIVCHENSVMALNTTWTVRLTVKVTAPAGTVITESAATMADNPDPNMANNTATVSLTVVP